MSSIVTLSELANQVIRSYHNPKAFAEKQDGQWVYFSTEEFISSVRDLSIGLKANGLQKGDRVGLFAPSSPRWVMADLAIVMAGGITVPIFANISESGFAYIVEDSAMKFLFIDGDEAIEKLENLKESFEKIIYFKSASQSFNTTTLIEVQKTGRNKAESQPQVYREMCEAIVPQDVITYIYTSGSTGVPKGVELTHLNLTSQITGAQELFDIEAGKDIVLSSLPLAHIFEKMVVYFYMSKGVSIYFADDVKNLGALMKEVRPTLMTVVPRLLEKVHASILSKARENPLLKKWLSSLAFRRAQEKNPMAPIGLFDRIYDGLVYYKVREAMGGRLRMVISGGSALSVDVASFFMNVGVPIYQGYGMTECSPVIASNTDKNNRLGTVGKVFPEVEVKISPEGEILVKGPGVMKGYHLKPEETAKVIDREGWLHTGDKGVLSEDGFLTITGRIKELFKTSTGKYVSPVQIEQLLNQYYLIDMSMVIGENRKYVTCLLFPDLVQVKKLMEKLGVSESLEVFLQSATLKEKFDKFIKETNAHFNHWEEVQYYQIISQLPTIEDGGLTPTMKIRRHVISNRYTKEIEAMYQDK